MTATVAGIWRYPVKSLQGLPAASLSLGPRGVRGDRRYALVDSATDRTLSAKSRAELLMASAVESADGGVVLTLPDARTIGADDPAVADVLSAWMGRPVTLVEADTGEEPLTYDERSRSYEMTFDPEHDDAERIPIPSPAGTFLDLAAVHVLTTGSIARCHETRPDTTWDVRRFRPNILVDLDTGGFPEDAWVGHRVRIGTAVISVDQRTVRCAMPVRAQPGAIDRDVVVYRTMLTVHDNHLGVYCSVVDPGIVRTGDAVEVLDR
ncbi:MAG: uncharacterized protein QOK15_2793 [Nocardioidaceae bacterium]|nr:uncharacterized protein [Nocardioidaceae bacterium]